MLLENQRITTQDLQIGVKKISEIGRDGTLLMKNNRLNESEVDLTKLTIDPKLS